MTAWTPLTGSLLSTCLCVIICAGHVHIVVIQYDILDVLDIRHLPGNTHTLMMDMPKRARFRFRRFLWLIGLICALLLAACGTTAQPQRTTSHSQAGPTTQYGKSLAHRACYLRRT